MSFCPGTEWWDRTYGPEGSGENVSVPKIDVLWGGVKVFCGRFWHSALTISLTHLTIQKCQLNWCNSTKQPCYIWKPFHMNCFIWTKLQIYFYSTPSKFSNVLCSRVAGMVFTNNTRVIRGGTSTPLECVHKSLRQGKCIFDARVELCRTHWKVENCFRWTKYWTEWKFLVNKCLLGSLGQLIAGIYTSFNFG